MPLSDDVRGELAAIKPRKACCRLAELSALLRTAGSVHLRGSGRIGLHVEVSSSAVARRAFSLLRAFGVVSEIRTYNQPAFERPRRFQLHVDDDARAIQVLNEAGVVDSRLVPLDRPPKRLVAKACCRAAYLRGAFLAAGSVSGPRNAHLEIRAANVEGARFLAELGEAEGFALRARERRGHAFAYAKSTDAIAELLAFLGAHDAALRFGEDAVVTSTRGRANRLSNADHANIVRASRAADAQLRAIRRLERAGTLASLPKDLRELADLRLRYPGLSLRELARKCRPPASKAAAHRRLRKLQRLAER